MCTCIEPLYKRRGGKYECSNFTGICLLSVVGKLHGRELIKRVRDGTECVIGEEQCSFRKCRMSMDQEFAETGV